MSNDENARHIFSLFALRRFFVIRHLSLVIFPRMNLSPERRIAGVLVPLFALRGEDDLGIGDLGALREFIDWAAAIGFKLIQLLPINETGADNSPYNAISAMAIEPTTLHLAPNSPLELTRADFDSSLSDIDLPSLRVGGVKYRQVKGLKRRILEKAFANFSAHATQERQLEFRTFCEQKSAWLHDYAFFRVLMEENDDSAEWNRWAAQHQTVEKARTWLRDLAHDRQAAVIRRQEFFCYVQWVAHQQWRAIKSYAEERGVALEAYSPLGTGQHLGHETVERIAARVSRTPAQVLIRWCLERGVIVIPKSTHRERIEENFGVFDFSISAEDMAELDALDRTGGTARARESKWW